MKVRIAAATSSEAIELETDVDAGVRVTVRPGPDGLVVDMEPIAPPAEEPSARSRLLRRPGQVLATPAGA